MLSEVVSSLSRSFALADSISSASVAFCRICGIRWLPPDDHRRARLRAPYYEGILARDEGAWDGSRKTFNTLIYPHFYRLCVGEVCKLECHDSIKCVRSNNVYGKTLNLRPREVEAVVYCEKAVSQASSDGFFSGALVTRKRRDMGYTATGTFTATYLIEASRPSMPTRRTLTPSRMKRLIDASAKKITLSSYWGRVKLGISPVVPERRWATNLLIP